MDDMISPRPVIRWCANRLGIPINPAPKDRDVFKIHEISVRGLCDVVDYAWTQGFQAAMKQWADAEKRARGE